MNKVSNDDFNLLVLSQIDTKRIRAERLNMYYSEANKDENTATPGFKNLSISMAVNIFKSLQKFITNAYATVARANLNGKGRIDAIIKAERVLELAESIAKANNDKSKHLPVFEKIVKHFSGFKYKQKNDDAGVFAIISGVYYGYMVECTGIMAEACASTLSGRYSSLDESINNHATYKKIFENANQIVNTDKLQQFEQTLYKTSYDGEGAELYGSLTPRMQELIGEGDTQVDLLKIGKVMLFKVLYSILAPIRYILYLIFFCAFSLVDRAKQTSEILDVYYAVPSDKGKKEGEFTQTPVPTDREGRIKEIDKSINNFRVDRLEAAGKAEKTAEEDRINLTKQEKDNSDIVF